MGGGGCLQSGTTSSPVRARWKAPIGGGGGGGGGGFLYARRKLGISIPKGDQSGSA